MVTHRTLSLPKTQYNAIEDYIKKNPSSGYTSVPEFIKDAIRRLLEFKKTQSTKEYPKLEVQKLAEKFQRIQEELAEYKKSKSDK